MALIGLLRRAAAVAPDQPAIISADRSLSYAACVERADGLARGLRDRGVERFGCALEDPADVLLVLAASSAVGSEACLYTRGIDADGVDALAATFAHGAVVVDPGMALAGTRALTPDELAVPEGEPPAEPARAPVLVLTTGTTGHQRAVRHDWARLVKAVGHADAEPGARWLLAYNLAQFGGIQVLLHALVSRATLVAASSRRPGDAIAAMVEHGVTRASATPTFWRLLAGSLDADAARELSLEQITLGGEAVQASLLERLRLFFPDAHISQIYGATEFGTAVSVRDGRPGLPLSVLDRGEDASVRLRIVDGELQMRSRVGMQGYHGEGDAGEDWRGTGDLVEVRADRIHFVGRRSEIINVGGAKVHPLPIEEAASAVDGVELAAAYGRANPVTGQIVALDVVAAPGADTGAIEAAVRAACAALPAAARPRRIRFVEAMETRGNKLSRPGPEAQR